MPEVFSTDVVVQRLPGETLDQYALRAMGIRAQALAADLGYIEPSAEDKKKIAHILEEKCFHCFCEYVFRDERGEPITQQPFHREWHDFETSNTHTVLWAPVEHGKTKQRTVYYTLWTLGWDHERLICIISAVARGSAWRMLSEIKEHITSNVRLHQVFPDLRKGKFWRHDEIAIEREMISKDPTITAIGVHGQINGSRLTDIIGDDVLNFKNTYSKLQRQKLLDWFQHEVMSRTLAAATVHLRGTAWKKVDMYHVLADEYGFESRRYRATSLSVAEIREADDDADPRSLWPGKFDMKRLKDTLHRGGSGAFVRTMLNEPRDDSTQFFKTEWIAKCLELGRGLKLLERYAPRPGDVVRIGADLANSKKIKGNDSKAFATLLFSQKAYRLLWLIDDAARRWTPTEHINHLGDLLERYPGSICRVENNFGQQHFIDHAEDKLEVSKARIEAVFTGINKYDPVLGVEGIAVSMERGELILPSPSDEKEALEEGVDKLCTAFADYVPEDHVPDALAAFWFAWSGIEKVRPKPEFRSGRQKRERRGVGMGTRF